MGIKTGDSASYNNNLNLYARQIRDASVGLKVKEWKPLTNYWAVQGYDRQAEVNHFLHELPSKVK